MAETIAQKLERIKAEQKAAAEEKKAKNEAAAATIKASLVTDADDEPVQLAAPAVETEAVKVTDPSSDKDTINRARTHRLIQVGAVADQYLGTAGADLAEVEALLRQLVQLPEVVTAIRTHKKARAMIRTGR